MSVKFSDFTLVTSSIDDDVFVLVRGAGAGANKQIKKQDLPWALKDLSNLGTTAISGALLLGTSDGGALGSGSKMWSDLFLASGAVINFNNGDVTLTHSSDKITVAGGTLAVPDDAYGSGWNGSTDVPTKNAVYDKIQSILVSPTFLTSLLITPNSALPTGAATLRVAEVDGVGTTIVSESFATNSSFSGRRANGTGVSPSALSADNTIVSYNAVGYGATGYSTSRGGMRIMAAENWSDSVQGTYLSWRTTLIGAATAGGTERMRLTDVGNLKIGGTALRGTTEGLGHIDLFNGTDPVGTLTNGVSFFARSGQSYILDSAGRESLVGAGIPQNSQTANYTTVLNDSGKHILHPTSDNNARTFTIDSNANVAYPIGSVLTVVNQINTLSVAIASDTMTFYPSGGTGTRTVPANNILTAIKVSATGWICTGTSGVT